MQLVEENWKDLGRETLANTYVCICDKYIDDWRRSITSTLRKYISILSLG